MEIKKLKSGNIEFTNNDGTKMVLLPTMNIISDINNKNYIIITPEADPWDNNNKKIIDYTSVSYPVSSSRNELIDILARDYFNNIKKDDSRFLDSIGDGTGIIDFIGNYATTPLKAIIKPTQNHFLFINRLIVFIADNSSVDAGFYGNNITLNNGIEIKHEKQDGTLIKDITNGIPVKTNADFAKFGFQVSDISFGSGLNYVHAVISFYKNGSSIILEPDEQLAIYLNDDFSSLKEHTFKVGAFHF